MVVNFFRYMIVQLCHISLLNQVAQTDLITWTHVGSFLVQFFCCSFLDKLYVMSTSEALGYFMRNPRPYLAAHLPRPPCKLCVLGPPHSGKTTVARMLADRYNAKVRWV